MASIDNARLMTEEEISEWLAALDSAQLLAQEITQFAALHCLKSLQIVGVSEANVEGMIDSIRRLVPRVVAEYRRRGLIPVMTEDSFAESDTIN